MVFTEMDLKNLETIYEQVEEEYPFDNDFDHILLRNFAGHTIFSLFADSVKLITHIY